jgi:hypothetical protein
MTVLGTAIATVLAAGVVAAGGALGEDPGAPSGTALRTALVIDADAARDGRNLIDAHLREVGAAVRLPRTAAEANTNVRYFAAQDYRLVVAGPRAWAAAKAAGVTAIRASGLAEAVAAASR